MLAAVQRDRGVVPVVEVDDRAAGRLLEQRAAGFVDGRRREAAVGAVGQQLAAEQRLGRHRARRAALRAVRGQAAGVLRVRRCAEIARPEST